MAADGYEFGYCEFGRGQLSGRSLIATNDVVGQQIAARDGAPSCSDLSHYICDTSILCPVAEGCARTNNLAESKSTMAKNRHSNIARSVSSVALALAAASATALICSRTVASPITSSSASVAETGVSGQPSADTKIAKPDTEEKFLRNLKSAVDGDAMFRPDFYTQESLYRYFAVVNVVSGVVREDDNEVRIWARAGDFEEIFPRVERKGASGPVANADIAVGLSMSASNDKKAELNFGVLESGLTFERVRRIFDTDLTLDKSIPHEPPPPPLGPHANEAWWYIPHKKGEAIRGLLQFDSAGFLKGASFELEQAGASR